MLGESCSAPSSQSKNPIDFAIGNKLFMATDYRSRGVFPIVFSRTYNSLDKGWKYSYGQRIESQSSSEVEIVRPSGRRYTFELTNGQWNPDPDVVSRLEGDAATGWIYTQANNTKEHYDSSGRLVSITRPSGATQSISYNAGGEVFTVHSPSGNWLEVTLNEAGQPAQLLDSSGEQVTYAYTDGFLTRVTHADGTTTDYLYEVDDKPWLITGIIDENGHRSNTVAYDDEGRAIMSELADGAERVEVSYNDDDSTTLTNALGKKTRFEFETLHGVKKIVTVEGEPTATCQGTAMAYQFDENGFLTEKTDAKGIVTRYTRDDNGLALSRTEAVGTPEERTVTTEWDTERRLPLKVTTPEHETTYRYNASGLLLGKTVQPNQ